MCENQRNCVGMNGRQFETKETGGGFFHPKGARLLKPERIC